MSGLAIREECHLQDKELGTGQSLSPSIITKQDYRPMVCLGVFGLRGHPSVCSSPYTFHTIPLSSASWRYLIRMQLINHPPILPKIKGWIAERDQNVRCGEMPTPYPPYPAYPSPCGRSDDLGEKFISINCSLLLIW